MPRKTVKQTIKAMKRKAARGKSLTQKIRERAYLLHLDQLTSDRYDGDDLSDWLKAENQVKTTMQAEYMRLV